ncbi:hypothetical protein FHT97_005888 [Rhizobium sp. BK399]|nr:hypothetical protein [Rhizobium sp. BK399]MCS3743877.1 hypothetical protein [Rhizobium sp. BK661]
MNANSTHLISPNTEADGLDISGFLAEIALEVEMTLGEDIVLDIEVPSTIPRVTVFATQSSNCSRTLAKPCQKEVRSRSQWLRRAMPPSRRS